MAKDRICPKCKGAGHGDWRPKFGTCYRCNGFGTLNPDGSKKKTAQQLREEKEQAEFTAKLDELRACYHNDPRYPDYLAHFENLFSNILDVFQTPEQAALSELHELDGNPPPWKRWNEW